MEEQLKRVRQAYNRTVEQFRQGIDPYTDVPASIRETEFFNSMSSIRGQNSAAPDIRNYLEPKAGQRFLDVGCSANLANYDLGEWPSTYYGIDISPALIEAMKGYAARNNLVIGDLAVAELTELPFDTDYFDIAACIGVLEYGEPEYVTAALEELGRVMKPESRFVLDIPNPDHPWANDMQRLEAHLDRPVFLHPRDTFEKKLKEQFKIERTDDSGMMIKYFVRSL